MSKEHRKKERVVIFTGLALIAAASVSLAFQLKSTVSSDKGLLDFNYQQAALAGENVSFENISDIGDEDNWEWDFGDGYPSVDSRSTSHAYETGGLFTVSLTYTGQEPPVVKRQVIAVTGSPPPNAQFSLEKTNFKVGEQVTFANTSNNADEFIWTFDNKGNASYEVEPTFVYDEPGTYRVLLMATNKIGQVHEHTMDITVEESKIATIATHQPIYDESSLTDALTGLANSDMSRRDKKSVKRQIILDAASISIPVGSISLENYLNKIQLEASSNKISISVAEIRRNRANKIIEIIIE
ncbi:MAG: PKD domain-containing protein [Cyclobacteriaceae bacterium]